MTQPSRRQLEKDAARQRDDDARAVLSTVQGRRFLWRLVMGTANVMGQSFSGDAANTAFAEGRRAVGIDVVAELQRVDPRAYLAMVTEAANWVARQLEAEAAEPKPADE